MWKAEYIQFSWFSRDFGKQDIDKVYEELVGVESDATQRFKKFNPLQSAISQATGNSEDFNYLVGIDPFRLDFIIRKKLDGSLMPIGPLLDLESNLDKFVEMVTEFNLCGIESVDRLALIANLSKLYESFEDSNREFLNLCPLKLDANDVSDLMFRCNKRRELDNKCVMNRLMNFNVNVMEGVFRGEPFGNAPRNGMKYFVLNVNLDLNTVPQPLESKMHVEIWKNFANEVLKLSKDPSLGNLE